MQYIVSYILQCVFLITIDFRADIVYSVERQMNALINAYCTVRLTKWTDCMLFLWLCWCWSWDWKLSRIRECSWCVWRRWVICSLMVFFFIFTLVFDFGIAYHHDSCVIIIWKLSKHSNLQIMLLRVRSICPVIIDQHGSNRWISVSWLLQCNRSTRFLCGQLITIE